MKSLKNSIWLFVVAVVCVPFIAFAVVSWYEVQFKGLPVLGENNHTISDFQLKNQEGKIISTKNWDNKIVVANFFFTHCPVICP